VNRSRSNTGKSGVKPVLSGIFVTVNKFRNDCVGKRCVILASGPSMYKFNYEALNDPDIVTIAINEEGHRNLERHVPDYWIFSDLPFLERILKNGYTPSPKTQIVMKEDCAEAYDGSDVRIKNAKEPIAVWTPKLNSKRCLKGEFFMHKTTAAPAIGLAVMLGMKDIWLGGVDLCYKTTTGYYSDHNMDRVPPDIPLSKLIQMDSSTRITRMQLHMLKDLTTLKCELRSLGLDLSIYQGCLYSPLDCFIKKSFKEWHNGR